MQSNNIEVILASHAHHVPHVGLPQIDPVTRAIIHRTKPDGAKLLAIKEKFLFLKMKLNNDKNPIDPNVPNEIQAAGTCTYIILTECP